MDILWPIAIIVGIALLFGLQRNWNGRIRFSNEKSSASGGWMALQEIVEPNVKHVMQIKDQNRHGADNGPPGDDGNSL